MRRFALASFLHRRNAARSNAIGRWIVCGSLLATGIPMTALSANSGAAPQVVDTKERDAIVAAALAPAEKELATPVRLGVRSVASDGDWAFVLADLEDENGKPFDYSKSSRAEEAKRGLVSHRYAALLRRRD